MSVVIARSVSDEAIWKGQCLNGGERLLRFARNDILIVDPRIKAVTACVVSAGVGRASNPPPSCPRNVILFKVGCRDGTTQPPLPQEWLRYVGGRATRSPYVVPAKLVPAKAGSGNPQNVWDELLLPQECQRSRSASLAPGQSKDSPSRASRVCAKAMGPGRGIRFRVPGVAEKPVHGRKVLLTGEGGGPYHAP